MSAKTSAGLPSLSTVPSSTTTRSASSTGLVEKLLEAQHQEPVKIYSTMHVHVDHHNCMEIIAVSGGAKKVKAFADGMRSLKGVKRCELVVADAEG